MHIHLANHPGIAFVRRRPVYSFQPSTWSDNDGLHVSEVVIVTHSDDGQLIVVPAISTYICTCPEQLVRNDPMPLNAQFDYCQSHCLKEGPNNV